MSQIPHLNKRGNVWIIVGIVVVVFIVLAFVVVLVVTQTSWFNGVEEKEEVIPMIELYLRANELDSPSTFFDASVEISYSVNVTDEVRVASGVLRSDSYTPFLVPADRPVNVRCWNKDHYLVRAVKIHSPTELSANKSVMDCTSAKIGRLEISKVSGDLSKDYNIIKLNVTSKDGSWYRMGLCFEWTAGIVDVTTQDQWATCESGRWVNYSSYDSEKKVYAWLPENQWKCGDELEECKEVRINKCKLPSIVVPYRFSGIVDSCAYTSKTLANGESYELNLEVRTIEQKNSLDYIRIFFYDHDRRFSNSENRWVWESAHYEENLGAPDQEFIIPYDEQNFRGVAP